MVNPVATATVVQREKNPSATMHDSTPIEKPAPIEQQLETLPPVTESSKPATMNTAEAIERPVLTAFAHVTASPAAEPIIKSLQDGMSHSSFAASESAQDTTETTKSLLSDSVNSPASSPIDHAPSSQPTSQSSATAPQPGPQTGNSSSPMSQMDSGLPATTPQQTVVMNHPAITRTIPSRPDYGWLNELLKRRIMSLQAYPRLARMQGWEGVVVVKARIKSDGSLLHAVVTESSGYASLDEDALKLMQRACPIRLQQDLGQSQIDVLIPIHYRLER
jgi:protein TonB